MIDAQMPITTKYWLLPGSNKLLLDVFGVDWGWGGGVGCGLGLVVVGCYG